MDALAERPTFPQPDARTQILPTVPTPVPQVLYRERPIDLDKAACNISLAATRATLNRHSAIKLEEELAVHLRVVHALAARERAEGLKLLERPGNATAATGEALESLQNVAEAERKANELPNVKVTAEVDTDAFGADLGAVWTNARAVNDETARFPRITPGMPDPRVKVKVEQIEQVPATASTNPAAVPSPVHVEGGTAPPIPDEDDEDAEESDRLMAGGPLPRRHPRVTVLPAPMTTGEDPQPVGGETLDPTRDPIHGGHWLWDRGEGNGGAVLKLVRNVTLDVKDGEAVSARVFFADGSSRFVAAGGSVHGYSPGDVEPLRKAAEAELAELEASS